MLRAKAEATLVIFLYVALPHFRIGPLWVAIDALILAIYKPALNSQKSTCLCLPSAVFLILFCLSLLPNTCIGSFVCVQ